MTSPLSTLERRDLPLSVLDPPALDARISRDEAQVDELTRDIARRGLLYPLIVVRDGERYEIVDGYTRFICAKRIPLAVVPCTIYPTKEDALEGVKYAANIFRLDMSAAEEAVMFGQLFERECGQDIERLAALVGKSVSYIDARLRLLNGDAEIFEAVRRKEIGVGVAEELNAVTDAQYRHYYLTCAVRSGATKSVVVGWVTEWRNMTNAAVPTPAQVAPSAPGLAEDVERPFTCIICGKDDNVHLIRQVNVHQHCRLAILDPLLDHARSGS